MLTIPSILTFNLTIYESGENTFVHPVLAQEPYEINSKFRCLSGAWVTVVLKLLKQVDPVAAGSSEAERAQAAQKLKHRIIQQFRTLGFDVYGNVKPGSDHDTYELVLALEDTQESKRLGNITLMPPRILPHKITRNLTYDLCNYYHVGGILVWDKACWRILRIVEGIRSLSYRLENIPKSVEYSLVASMSLEYLGEVSMRQMDVLEELANHERHPARRVVRGLDPLREFVIPKDVDISISVGTFDSLGRINAKVR